MMMMIRITILILLLIYNIHKCQCQGIYDYNLIDIDGNEVSLAQYKGTKVILIVNIAMDDGLTFRNNKELEVLHSKYHNKGLEILAILSNDFATQQSIPQKPSIGSIATIFQNTKVTGDTIHPLFTYLTSATDNIPINWNFCKFLIVNGKPVKRYQPTVHPLKIEPDILNYLKSSEL
jgi:glutathione peroxidase